MTKLRNELDLFHISKISSGHSLRQINRNIFDYLVQKQKIYKKKRG